MIIIAVSQIASCASFSFEFASAQHDLSLSLFHPRSIRHQQCYSALVQILVRHATAGVILAQIMSGNRCHLLTRTHCLTHLRQQSPTTAFFSFLRKSNLVSPTTSTFHCECHLTRSNIKFTTSGCFLRIKWSKTRRQHTEGIYVDPLQHSTFSSLPGHRHPQLLQLGASQFRRSFLMFPYCHHSQSCQRVLLHYDFQTTYQQTRPIPCKLFSSQFQTRWRMFWVCMHRLQARQRLANGALIQLMMHNVIHLRRRTYTCTAPQMIPARK